MSKLLLVESPTKARRMAAFLKGQDWKVLATRGHVRDLPHDTLGVDIARGFALSYVTLPDRRATLGRLRTAVSAAEAIYLATDPDREGEAIAWHLLDTLKQEVGERRVYRVVCNAITPEALQAALTTPRPLDVALVEAQQARRTVDRLVGYLVSPLVCKLLDRRVSAGRVQSVCLRLVTDREREIEAFAPHHYWTLSATFHIEGDSVTARFARVMGKRPLLTQRAMVDRLMAGLQTAVFWVEQVSRAERTRTPLPPFTTASLQQAASKALGFTADRTMKAAQTLYEQGHITYIRTASVTVPAEVAAAARAYIAAQYGEQYAGSEQPLDHTPKASPEAHEAIRPTDLIRIGSALPSGDGAKVYDLIWRRFIASQMAPAVYDVSAARICAGKYPAQPYPLEFHATGRRLRYDGFLKVYEESLDDGETRPVDIDLPSLHPRQFLTLGDWQPQGHTTSAPDRYTEAALINALERRGIGRPSTYAVMLHTLRERRYVQVDKKRLVPTPLGMQLSAALMKHFTRCFEDGYTASLESALDLVALGRLPRLDLLDKFWERDFAPLCKALAEQIAPPTGSPSPRALGTCPQCGSALVARQGRHGVFAGCSQFPRCKGTGLSVPVRITGAETQGA